MSDPFVIPDEHKIAYDTRYIRRNEIEALIDAALIQKTWVFDDFINGVHHFSIDISASGSVTQATGFASHPGVARLRVTANLNNAAIYLADSSLLFGGGELRFKVVFKFEVASSVANYVSIIGFSDVAGGAVADAVDGAYFKYTSGSNSNQWQCVTSNNSTRTTTTTAVTANNTDWHTLECVVNTAGTEAKFYIDGVLVATHSSNIPTSAGREFGFMCKHINAAVGVDRSTYVDYAYVEQILADRPLIGSGL